MDSTAKTAAAVGAGILIGKTFGTGAWWLLAGAAVLFIMKSPGTQAALGSGAQKAYALGSLGARKAYAKVKSK